MTRFPLTSTAALVAVAAMTLSACGGGGGGSDAAPTAAAGTTVTVSPSLGKFSPGAHVHLLKPDRSLLGKADITSAGTASVNVGSYAGPLLVEVSGDTGVTYYDEGTKDARPFGASEVLRAIAPAVQTSVGVTPATHAAVEAIKFGNGGSIPVAISSADIGAANAKIAAALGISDVLQAPKLVDGSTSTTLDLANVSDKYALQLAALAKLAIGGKTALDVAKEIASDLSDGKLDGQVNGTPIPNRSTGYTVASVAADIANLLKSAASDLGNTNTAALVNSDPTVLGTVKTDVTQVVAPSAGVLQAKAMFAELRTTLNSFSNSAKTGFLNNQALRMSDDVNQVVSPEASKLFSRLSVIDRAITTFEGAQAGITNTGGVYSGTVSIPGEAVTSAWISESGTLNNVLAGTGGTQYCFVARPVTASSPITCYASSAGSFGFNGSSTFIKFIKFVVMPAASGQYSYTATRQNRTWDPATSTLGPESVVASVPTGAGSVTKTASNLTLTGTMPPSATNIFTGAATAGVDTITLSSTKSGSSAANTSYALTGSVSATSVASSKPVTFSLDTGSHIDVDESNAAGTGNKLLAFALVGTARTDATKLTGNLSMSGFTTDKSGTSTVASTVSFTGTLSDTSPSGAGDFLVGKLDATVTGYSNYDVTMLTAGSNYIHGTASFTGTVQAPSRPQLKLVVSGNATGANTGDATVNYSYGTVSITGSGTSSPSAGSSFTLSNQDGITIAADPSNAHQNLISKSGVTLGTFSSGVINYADGTSETFN